MAHFAQIDQNNVVTQVIVVNNSECQVDGVESEAAGIAFCKSLFGADSFWVQTSYNGSIRKHYAGIGFTFDAGRDAFIAPKPFASWVLNETTCIWEAPVPYPVDGGPYVWNEELGQWDAAPAPDPERARNPDGTFIGDDPATPDVNEAWTDGGQS